MSELSFGYYPHHFDCNIKDVCISTHDGLEENVKTISTDPHVVDKWLYSPLRERRDIFSGEVTALPYPARIFGLPHTHSVSSSNTNEEERLQFLVWCFGFFVGMRTTTTTAGFADATPIEPYMLVDFVLNQVELSLAIENALHFWDNNNQNPRTTKAVTGIIHSLFNAQLPQLLCFERFIYLYTAIDGCSYVYRETQQIKGNRPSHSQRIDEMCQGFDMSTPSWATRDGAGKSIVDLRNETLHESLFFDEPLGFQIYQEEVSQDGSHSNTLLEMEKLVCRLLVALIGIKDESYIKSAIDDRQTHSLEPK